MDEQDIEIHDAKNTRKNRCHECYERILKLGRTKSRVLKRVIGFSGRTSSAAKDVCECQTDSRIHDIDDSERKAWRARSWSLARSASRKFRRSIRRKQHSGSFKEHQSQTVKSSQPGHQNESFCRSRANSPTATGHFYDFGANTPQKCKSSGKQRHSPALMDIARDINPPLSSPSFSLPDDTIITPGKKRSKSASLACCSSHSLQSTRQRSAYRSESFPSLQMHVDALKSYGHVKGFQLPLQDAPSLNHKLSKDGLKPMLKKSKDTNTWKLEKTTSLCKIQDQSGKIIGVAHIYKSPVKSSFARMDSLNRDSSKRDMPVEKNNDKDGQVIHAAELDTSKSINDSKMLQEISETIIPVENTCGSICKVSYCQNFAGNQRLVDFITNFELNKFSGDMSHGNAKELSNVHDCSDYLNATSLEESKKYSKCNLSKSSVEGKFDTITRTISNSTHKIPIDEQALVINNNMSHSPGLRHTHSDNCGVLSHGTFESPQNKLSNNSFVVSPSFQSNDNHAIRLGWCSRTCTESTFQPLHRSASSRDVNVDSDLKININDGTSSGTCNDAIAPHDLFFVRSVNNDTSSGKIVASNAKSSTKTHRFSVEEFGKPCGMSKEDVPRDQGIDRKSIHEWFYQSSADLHSKDHEGSCPEGFLKSKPRVDSQPIGDYGVQFKGKVDSEGNEQHRNKMIDEENMSKNTERWFPEETKEGSRNIETFESLDAINNLGGYPASSFPNESEAVLESALVPEVSHDRNSGPTSPGTKECCDASSSTLEDYVSSDRNLQCLQLASESSFKSISPENDDHVQKHVCRESVFFDAKVTPESFKASKTNRNKLNCPLGILRDRYQDIQRYHSTVFESEKNFEPSEHITWPETPALLHLTNHSDHVSLVNSATQSKSPHVPIHTWKSSETELRDFGIGLPVPGETFKMQTEVLRMGEF